MGAQQKVGAAWLQRAVLAAVGAVAVAVVPPLGSVGAEAAGSTHVSASTLVNRACHALLTAPAFRAQGTIKTGGQAMSVIFYVGSSGNLFTITQHSDQTVSIITNGPSVYIKGNQPFWEQATKNYNTASQLAGNWLDVSSDKKDFADLTGSLSKKQLISQCSGNRSTRYEGQTTFNGVKVTKVHQNLSGESDTYYIEKGPNPYILKIMGSPSEKNSGNLVFSDFGVQPNTAEPAGTLPISQFQ
jgi:hypothetical protein